MDGAKLQAELAETKAELDRLKESLTVATPVVHKDLSLVSLVPKWSGSDSSIPLEEFFSSIESVCRMGRWKDRDCVEIASLKVTDSAKLFYQGCPELHNQKRRDRSLRIRLGKDIKTSARTNIII